MFQIYYYNKYVSFKKLDGKSQDLIEKKTAVRLDQLSVTSFRLGMSQLIDSINYKIIK